MEMLIRTIALVVAWLALSLPAHAYLDPMTGSLLIQGLIALVAGVVAGVRSVRDRIIAALASLFHREPR